MHTIRNMERRGPTFHVELSHEDPDDALLAGDIFSSGQFYNWRAADHICPCRTTYSQQERRWINGHDDGGIAGNNLSDDDNDRLLNDRI